MFKVLIADDEQIVIDGIKYMIEELFDDIEIVATVNTGREAIEASRNIVPDIVLMDIKMPGIDGIKAIESIRRRHQHTKFIIISAYEKFELAKQALELNVSQYILKPVSKKKLKDVLSLVMNEIEDERYTRLMEMENREKLERIMPVLEHGFIYTLLMNADFKSELRKYRELIGVMKDQAYVMTIELSGFNQKLTSLDTEENTILEQRIYSKIHNELKYKSNCIVGPKIINRITSVISVDSGLSEYEARVKAVDLAISVKASIESITDNDVTIGIGSCYEFSKIKRSYEEAVLSLNHTSRNTILHINDYINIEKSKNEYTFTDIKDDEVTILNLFETCREDKLKRELKSFFNKLNKKFGASLPDIRNVITELMVMILSSSYRHKLKENEVGYSTYIREINTFDNIETLQNWCLGKILNIVWLINNRRDQHVSTVVMDAKKYIDDHYNEDLGLNDVSKMVSMSPQYFSKIFKEEIGLSFVEYIRQKRMDVAKSMLREKKYSVKEVCYEIGYNDPNYFSRLFKKIVGVSPTDY